MFDFGELQTNPGGYYFSLIDIETLGRWTLPQDGSGSYVISFRTDNGNAPATCVQTMLWGSPNNTGGDPDGPGWQGPFQIEYNECYDYTIGACPDPLGGMAQFWGTREDPPGDRADFNGDGFTDTRDVTAFLAAWAVCAPEADCNHDRQCDTRDVLCYLSLWAECRD